eukprot:TRINITY_DN6024_c0_g1_i1.p1 TRINITY_DN6024_c0_g1~~TRINITY_DN6024_c0_g1_i1.p1  ORF type:complete len:490 (-),score=49.31 TRINITY_DN6024_c0_g1_i1:63-1532(-)
MERNRRSILDGLGEEIIRIVSPVSLCMLLVVILVTILNKSTDSSSYSVTTLATLIYDEQSSDSDWEKFGGALLNALVFVGVVTVVTFLLVCLFYYRCTKFLRFYMNFAAFVVLGYMGGGVAVLLIQAFSIPIDYITFGIILFNFTVVGVVSVFGPKIPILFNQGYLIVIGMLVAYWFTMLPEWTTWVLLVAMAVYDVVAVLFPGGPLRMLVELAISRDEEIPALIYEARPVVSRFQNVPGEDSGELQRERRVWRRHPGSVNESNSNSGNQESNNRDEELAPLVSQTESVSHIPVCPNGQTIERISLNSQTVIAADQNPNPNPSANPDPDFVNSKQSNVPSLGEILREESSDHRVAEPPTLPLLEETSVSRESVRIAGHGEDHTANRPVAQQDQEGIGLSSSGAIKLGLGDFIFYSVLVGRAAMYDYMTVYACYLAIIGGLGVTLALLGFFRKALPALPVSISLGVVFYFLTRLVMEAFVVQVSIHLLLF